MKARIWNRCVTDHVAEGAGRLVEARTLAESEGLGHVDLHVVDEVAVPDRLEEAVGETEREDVLRRLLAEEVVDAKDLLFGEDLVQPRVERDRTREIDAERLLHHDARPVDQAGLAERADHRQRGARRHAQVVEATALDADRLLGSLDRRPQRRGTGGQRHVVERCGEGLPGGIGDRARLELVEGLTGERPEAVDVERVERHADDPTAGDEAGRRQVEEPGQQLAPRQVARRTDQHHDLRESRTHASRYLCHGFDPRGCKCRRASSRRDPRRRLVHRPAARPVRRRMRNRQATASSGRARRVRGRHAPFETGPERQVCGDATAPPAARRDLTNRRPRSIDAGSGRSGRRRG